MAMTTASRLAQTFRPRLSVRSLVAFLVQADSRHRARQQLASLDDHLLRDMGLTRADRDAELNRLDW